MKTFRAFFLRTWTMLAIGLLVAGVLSTWAPNTFAASSGSLDEVRSITFPASYYISDVVAEKKGFFTEEGLHVKFIRPQSGTNAIQLMASGEVGVMINDGALTLLAQSKGFGITQIGSLFNRNVWRIYTSDKVADLNGTAKTNPRGLKALEGKKIGVTSIDAGTDLALQGLLKKNGMNPNKDVKRIGIGLLTSAIGQFENKGIDAYVSCPPADDMLGKDKLAHRFYSMADADPATADVLQGNMIASTKWLNAGNHRDVAKRWILAQEKALNWIQDPKNLQEAGALFASAFGGTSQGGVVAVQYLNKTIFPHNLKGLKVPHAEFANSVAQLKGLGMFTGKAPSYDEAVDKLGRE